MRSLFFLVSSQRFFFEDKPISRGEEEVSLHFKGGRVSTSSPLCLFSNFLFTLTSALRDPLSHRHHRHLLAGPGRQGLRGLAGEWGFTARSGGDRQGLRWKGWRGWGGGARRGRRCHGTQVCFGGATTTVMHHRRGPASPSGFLSTILTEHKSRSTSLLGTSKKHSEMKHFSRQLTQSSL